MFLVRIKGFSNSGNVGTLNSCILITGSTFDVDSNIVVCLNAILEFGDRSRTAWFRQGDEILVLDVKGGDSQQ